MVSLYRGTILGILLEDTIDEMVEEGKFSYVLGLDVLAQFDQIMPKTMEAIAKTKLTFSAKKMNFFRYSDNVWTFALTDFGIEGMGFMTHINRVKIIACNSRMVSLSLRPTIVVDDSTDESEDLVEPEELEETEETEESEDESVGSEETEESTESEESEESAETEELEELDESENSEQSDKAQ